MCESNCKERLAAADSEISLFRSELRSINDAPEYAMGWFEMARIDIDSLIYDAAISIRYFWL